MVLREMITRRLDEYDDLEIEGDIGVSPSELPMKNSSTRLALDYCMR